MNAKAEIYYALKALHFAITDKSELSVEHPGHEAYLNCVAIPRAKEVLEKFSKEIEKDVKKISLLKKTV